MYVVLSGTVTLHKAVGERETELGRLESGAYFGEMALIGDAPRSATIRAATDLDYLAIDRDTLMDVIAAFPTVALQILRGYNERLADTTERLARLSARPTPAEIACAYGGRPARCRPDESGRGAPARRRADRPLRAVPAGGAGASAAGGRPVGSQGADGPGRLRADRQVHAVHAAGRLPASHRTCARRTWTRWSSRRSVGRRSACCWTCARACCAPTPTTRRRRSCRGWWICTCGARAAARRAGGRSRRSRRTATV